MSKSGAKGVLWRWLDAVEELSRVDEDLTVGQRSAIRLVALKRARCADADGRNSWPSQETLAEFAGVTRVTARWVDGWLVGAGLVVLTKVAGRRVSKRYRLVLPDSQGDRADDHLDESKVVVGTTILENQGGRLDARLGGRGDDHDLLPPTYREEEEESADARSADAPLAALPPSDLFTNDTLPEVVDAEVVEWGRAIAVQVSRRLAHGVTLDPGRKGLAQAMAGAKARLGCNDPGLIDYCAEKLRRKRAVDPTAFLATDLRTRVTETTLLPSEGLRAEYADLFDRLTALEEQHAASYPPFPQPLAEGADARAKKHWERIVARWENGFAASPMGRYERLLAMAGVTGDWEEFHPDPAEVKDDQLEAVIKIARQIVEPSGDDDD